MNSVEERTSSTRDQDRKNTWRKIEAAYSTLKIAPSRGGGRLATGGAHGRRRVVGGLSCQTTQ